MPSRWDRRGGISDSRLGRPCRPWHTWRSREGAIIAPLDRRQSMAKGRGSANRKGPKDALVEAMTQLVGGAGGGAKAGAERGPKGLRKLGEPGGGASGRQPPQPRRVGGRHGGRGGRRQGRRSRA